VKRAFKEFDAPEYYRCCDKNKVPESGRMFFSLLQYLYPRVPKPSTKEEYFYMHLRRAIKHVFRNFDDVEPISRDESIRKIPKNTSAGYVSMKYHGGVKLKKGECLPAIVRQYNENMRNIINGRPVNDYCTFAMRGHLSDRTQKKTRAIWLVSVQRSFPKVVFYFLFMIKSMKRNFSEIFG